MVDVFLVRHGAAAATWSESLDPALSAEGEAEAHAAAVLLARHPRPLALRSSPLRRAQETASALARAIGSTVEIDPRFRELPSLVPLSERAAWLQAIMQSRWNEVDQALLEWRAQAWSALLAIECDSAIFTHFMVINALVGMATGDERLVVFAPANGSVTHVRVEDGAVAVVARGQERTGIVL